ncbi:MAG: YIP1 family protein [Actinomycetota bacterium]|nr:YIP1 family protein [Actinomycetota bacterium]
MTSRLEAAPSEQRAWWLRALLVLQAPRAVFAAVREESPESLEARQEPLTAVVILAGIAWLLSTGTARTILDDVNYDAVVVAVWAFVVGALFGLASYWVVGGAVHLSARRLGSLGSYRRARHIVGFAAVPIALSIVLLPPLRIALYGGDIFREGGADDGVAGRALELLELGFVAWTLVLLVVGVRTVHGWTWRRATASVALGLGGLAAITTVLLPLLRGG